MTSVNSNFLKLQSNYLFAEIARKVASFKEANPETGAWEFVAVQKVEQ